MTSMLRRVVLVALLAAWTLPASAATTENSGRSSGAPTAAQTSSTSTGRATRTAASADEAQGYAAREQKSPGVQDFQGGDAYIYLGGGVLTAALIILLILIIL
jgi:hypothetical protein